MSIAHLLLAAVFLILAISIGLSDSAMHEVKRYDCSISEISPDYPVEVKEACRRILLEKIKE